MNAIDSLIKLNMRFLRRLLGFKPKLDDSNSMMTSQGRVSYDDVQQLVSDGCISIIDGKRILDTTLYMDIYWEAMRDSEDPANRDYYDQNYQSSRDYRESWLETPNGLAWKQRHGHN